MYSNYTCWHAGIQLMLRYTRNANIKQKHCGSRGVLHHLHLDIRRSLLLYSLYSFSSFLFIFHPSTSSSSKHFQLQTASSPGIPDLPSRFQLGQDLPPIAVAVADLSSFAEPSDGGVGSVVKACDANMPAVLAAAGGIPAASGPGRVVGEGRGCSDGCLGSVRLVDIDLDPAGSVKRLWTLVCTE